MNPQRLAGESASAYEAYREYCDLGPDRTLAATWQGHRQRSLENKPSRGRPRVKNVEARHPSGQWTNWASRWQWAERAADYDAQVDAEKRRADLERIQEREIKRLQGQLAVQKGLEELVWSLEGQLDQMGRLPLTGYTLRTREVDGKKVVATETQVQAINLRAYVRLLRTCNETARQAIIGTDKRACPFVDPDTARVVLDAPDTDPDRSFRGRQAEGSANALGPYRLPGESARAYRAFCTYRDQGLHRSLAGAWIDRPKAPKETTADRGDRGTPGVSAGHWPRWSSRWNWVARAAAHDARVEAAQCQAQRKCGQQIERRRLEFEFVNDERLESRCQKIRAILAKVVDAPITDIQQSTECRQGKKVRKTKMHGKGLHAGGIL